MNYETPCPYCKGVHYSFYNAQRCETRYRFAKAAAALEAKTGKPVETPEEKHARELAAWHRKRDSSPLTIRQRRLLGLAGKGRGRA